MPRFVVPGLLYGACLLALSVLLMGAGHGWIGGIQFGLAALLLGPLSFLLILDGKPSHLGFWMTLLAWAAMDLWLASELAQRWPAFARLDFSFTWLVLWLAPQLLIIVAYVRSFRRD